ncbi:putative RNA recognition motif domain, nucleotide-binding alpha-beta plait domain superfamily [Helianthus annuus]|nr:putative RNA recognition motif domain, nucleotide-binding alpha-beta plait domain superfamily [Helianthus annuus]
MNVGDEGGSWKDVPLKKNHKNKGDAGNTSLKGNITKFYITNLPLGCNPWDVTNFVKVFGDVAGVYLARKYDKEGRRFGFISFKNVIDVKGIEKALNGTKMGGYKLVANLARFAKENIGLNAGRSEMEAGNKRVPVKPLREQKIYNHAFVNKGGGRLFSDLFANNDSSKEAKSSMEREGGKSMVISDDTSAFKEVMGRALVGRCKDLTILRKLNCILAENRITGASLSYLGGLSMLIKFDNEEMCTNFLLDHALWEAWFSNLDVWNGQSFPFERLA